MMNVFVCALREKTIEMSIEQKTIYGNVKIVCFSNQSNKLIFLETISHKNGPFSIQTMLIKSLFG